MIPGLFILAWLALPVLGSVVFFSGHPTGGPTVLIWSRAVSAALGALGWIYLTVRGLRFRNRFQRFLRLLLAGEYDAGIPANPLRADPLADLEALANRLAGQLREIDRLRADRVAMHARMLDLILRVSGAPMLTADGEREVLTVNPAARKRLGISRNRYSFDSVLKAEGNEGFAGWFLHVLRESKSNAAATCRLRFPGMTEPVSLRLLFLPLRDRKETVRFALLLVDSDPVDAPAL